MLDLAKVRRAYFDPPADDPGRALTREELYARYERRRVEGCLLRGRDPRREGLGEHGSLMGGPDKPLTAFGVRPERAGRLQPLPLAWFDYPRARFASPPPGRTEEAHDFFAALAADHLAGMPERPSGARLARTFRSTELKGREWSQVWHVLACIRIWDLKRLLPEAGCRSTKSPGPFTSPTAAGPKSSTGSISSRFPPGNRRILASWNSPPPRPSSKKPPSRPASTLPISLGNPRSSILGDPTGRRSPETAMERPWRPPPAVLTSRSGVPPSQERSAWMQDHAYTFQSIPVSVR